MATTDAPHTDVETKPAPAVTAPIPPHPHKNRRGLWIVVGVVALLLLIVVIPWIIDSLNSVSTDDAYVNGHVTFVAPRVLGQVARVLVDDNNRVHKGDLLVELDKEPYQVQVNIAQSAVDAAQADVITAQAQVRSFEGQARSLRYGLQHAIEDVDNQISLLRSKAAILNSQKATADKTAADYQRALPLVQTGGITQEELDHRKQAMLVAQAEVEEALQGVYQVRVQLGLPPKPETGDDLTQVPDDLDQTFSSVRQAQYALLEAAAQLGVVQPFNQTPKQMLEAFYKRDPSGDIDK
ncbi:MAG TPA: biotin/lipoyl-binding protein, partial [Tepidisphaeraceae bacterium]|nr:biotin/lipoyl-binding protein [Tepidisphaeraceae bacterium]